MNWSPTITGTNIRMAVVLTVCLLASSPCRAEDASGATLITPLGRLRAPAVADSGSVWSLAITPAPYGLTELTTSTLAWNGSDMMAAISGSVGGGWHDVTLHGLARWDVTTSFALGAVIRLRWQGASGFASTLGVGSTIHALATIDDAWSLAAAINDGASIGTWREPLPTSLIMSVGRTGTVNVSASMIIVPSLNAAAVLSAMTEVSDLITLRGSLRTEPLSALFAARVAHESIVPVTVELTYVRGPGITTSIIVEIP